METINLKRIESTKFQTLGVLYFEGKEICKTLELAWLNNKKGMSCIPAGTYIVKRRYSAKYGNHFHLTNVPKREYILIHNANFFWQLKGCIAVGDSFLDIDGDGFKDVTKSIPTMKKLREILPKENFLIIIENPK